MSALSRAVANLAARLRPREGRQVRTSLVELAEFPDMNPGPVFRLDREGIILRGNVAARRVFQDDDLMGRCWFDLCPQMRGDRWRRVVEADDRISVELEVHGRWLVFSHAHRQGGEYVFVYGTEITERREAERKLAEMARFPEMNPGPVCRMDRGGIIVLANGAARRLFGDESLLSKSWLDVCPGVTRELWDRVLSSDTHVRHETRVGERHFVFAHTPGAVGVEIFVYGTDLTEQREAERALRQSEKMATLGTLAAGVAHELNNPAAAAQRAAQQLTETFARLQQVQLRLEQLAFSPAEREALATLDARARRQASCACELNPMARSDREAEIEDWLEGRAVEDAWELAPALVNLEYDAAALSALAEQFQPDHANAAIVWVSHLYPVYSLLDEIHHAAGRLSEIVGALKSYSYVGQAPVQAVDVNQGLRNTLIILRNKLKQGIEVVQELAPDLPRIQAHGGDLNQVWTNLIDNAVSAMGGRGRLTVRSRREHGWIVVDIEDEGPGIPPDIQSRIFDAFFTTKAPGEGTGLGLHTSYTIVVQKHQGTIDVSSRPGCTRFTVRLPVDSAPQ